MRMLDARVNAKDAWQRSIAARHGAAAALQAARGSATSIAARSLTSDAVRRACRSKVSGVTGRLRQSSIPRGADHRSRRQNHGECRP